MSFAVQPCFPTDASGLAASMMGARFTDPHWVALWEDPCLEDIITNATGRVAWNLIQDREAKRHQKVINVETGQVVGYARWTLPTILAEKKDVWLEAQVAEPSAADRQAFEKQHQAGTKNGRLIGMKSSNEMQNFCSAPLEEADARVKKDGPYLTLDYLTTSPDFWRRGVGSMLVQSGLKIADQHGIKTYVMSEPAGLKLYLNQGFTLVETVSIDYSQYGGTEPMVEYFLVREPVVRESG